MSYDIKILSVGASCNIRLCCGSVAAEKENGLGKLHAEKHPFAAKMKGEWFEIVKDGSDKLLGSFGLCDFDFDGGEKQLDWRADDERNVHYSLMLKDEEETLGDLGKLMERLQGLSPTGMLVFMTYLQEDDNDNSICGVLTLKEFLSLIPKKRVYSNVCYIIQD